MPMEASNDALRCFHPSTRAWFVQSSRQPTRVEKEAWPVLTQGDNALLLALTGSEKALAAFLVAILNDMSYFLISHTSLRRDIFFQLTPGSCGTSKVRTMIPSW